MTKSKEEFENIVYQSLKENNGFSENPGNIFNPFFECIASAALKEIEYEIQKDKFQIYISIPID